MKVHRTLALVALLALGAGCRTAPIRDVDHAPLPSAPLDARQQQIERAALMQGWEIQHIAPNLMIATKRRGRHVASTMIEFDRDSYSIRLRNSVALRQTDDRIHKTYNDWVERLEYSIRREADMPVPASVSSPPRR